MTAKEILESILFTWQPPFDDKEFKEHLLRYSEQLCREQRENCYNAYLDSGNESPLELFEIMINAKQPEI
jgi:hypothetical protein